MKILLIDTCGATGSVALADTASIPAVAASQSLPGRTASERLVATVREIAARAGISLQSLGAVVVVHGPGSFTGVRVGLSAAKGLCEALSLPLIAISRLAVLAHLADPPRGARVCAVIDAGRGEFYSGVYADGVCLREALLTRDGLLAEVGAAASEAAGDVPAANVEAPLLVLTCEASVAASLAVLAPQLLAEPTAEDALPLALLRLQTRDFDDAATLDANYLRRTDAEIFAKPVARAAAAPSHSQFQLRPAEASDLEAILALERAAETAPHWPPTAYADIFRATDPPRCLIVAQVAEALAGFAVGLMHSATDGSAERIAELESVVVATDARRDGVGRALCTAVFDWCRSQGATEIVLEVRAASAAATALYATLGFTETGRRPRYYHDPEDDALLMRRVLK